MEEAKFKKAIVIFHEGTPVCVCEIKDLEPLEFLNLEKQCAENYAKIIADLKSEKEAIKKEIEKLQHEIRELRGIE